MARKKAFHNVEGDPIGADYVVVVVEPADALIRKGSTTVKESLPGDTWDVLKTRLTPDRVIFFL